MAGEKPLIAAPRDRFVYYPGTQSVPFFAGAAGAQPPAQHHRRRRDPRGGRRGRAARAGHRRGRLHPLRQGPPAALHPQLGRPRAAARRLRRPSWRRAGTSCASSSSRPASPTPPRATGARAASSSTSTASSPATSRCPYTTPFAFNPGALTCGADPGSTGHGRLRRRRSASPGRIHTVTVDLSGELITDPEAELKLHMARQ